MRWVEASARTTWRRPTVKSKVESAAPYAPAPNGTPYSLASTCTVVSAGK